MKERRHFDLAEHPARTNKFKAILLVDDDRELVQTLQWMLADENFLVDKAYDGEEALLKVKANVYDAVICDVMMPKLRGDEFYLKAVLHRPSLVHRFIFVTGFAADRVFNHFLSQNKVCHFTKPVPIDKLIESVKELVA
jgi:DNA-binding response OmpR family regulator